MADGDFQRNGSGCKTMLVLDPKSPTSRLLAISCRFWITPSFHECRLLERFAADPRLSCHRQLLSAADFRGG